MRDLPFVLLAAGGSTRMGRSKALLDCGGRPWLQVQAEAILAQTEGPVRVVLSPEADPEKALVARLPGAVAVLNPDPSRGPFSSLQCGLEALSGPVFVGPLDCPVAPVLDLLRLEAGAEAAVPLFEGRGGHPVLLGPALVARLRDLDPAAPEARLDRQLRRAMVHHVRVQDCRVRLNLNTPEAWKAFLSARSART